MVIFSFVVKYMNMTVRFYSALAVLVSVPLFASQDHQNHSPYAGQESREIKSFSNADLAELRRGGGWGLAKAAELNGVPGPLHVLELKDDLGLAEIQIKAITAVFEKMRRAAVDKGNQLIALEAKLDNAFSSKTITADKLKLLLDEIGATRAELRFVHLSAHLEMDGLLSPHQAVMYNRLRGYDAGDPCASVPEGHDPNMWKLHNGCE